MKIILQFFLFIFIANFISAQQTPDKIFKSLDDDNTKFTNVGNIGLTITNFGTYGHGFTLWPRQPSCEYPIGSGIEHLFDGGLWIGAFTSNDSLGTGRQGPFVTTAAVDAASVSARGGGFEFTNKPGDRVVERSALLDSKVYSPLAVSHQDFVMEYSDTSTTLAGGEIIPDHNPIGVVIHHESYSWNLSFANNFVIMNYWIKNVSGKYLDSVFVGLWTDAVVRNTNITSPRTGGSFYDKGGNGYSPQYKIAYEFDATGDIGFTDSYVGIQFLGSSVPVDSVNFVSWQFRNTTDPNLFAPQNDVERYRKMEGYFGGNNRFPYQISPSILKTPSNRSVLITAGPLRNISPGDSVNVVFAIITAKKFGTDPAALDNEEQKTNLYTSAEWALRAYFGEDRNRNGLLDAGEDLDGDGKITRYILPTPPQNPKVKVVPESQKAAIYWDKRSEESVDPITGEKDFEGYRLYRTMSGFDLTASQDLNVALVKMAEFDSLGNDAGLNTGFSFVELTEPITFPNDTTKYWYKFEVQNLLNGWQYVFSVTAFDKGDVTFNLESLESGKLVNAIKIIPGVQPTSDENIEIGVYPNPYYANAFWDGNSERLRKIYFYNLPSECEITIYTLAGDVIKRLYHDQTSNGSDLRWFQTFSKDGKQIMSGGEHAWDLITDNDQAIATGLYLFSVKDLNNGNIKTGKFLIVK
uniref:Fibronectin type III domain protein n=1 Tax=Ignavibacterium album TaxID=591197 RepID=A0A832CVJ0_9BACT